jgi:hypothetical protein
MKYSQYYIQRYQQTVDYHFVEWIDEVEDIVFDVLNFELLDLPDENYMLMYEEHYKPSEVANIIISNFPYKK